MRDASGEAAKRAAWIAEKALRLLSETPLCDRCLGRFFALLGRGWSNAERGDALKRLLVMSLHAAIREGDEEAKSLFTRLAPAIGVQAATLYRELTGEELRPLPCALCGSRLGEWIERAVREAAEVLRRVEARSFLVAASLDPQLREEEDELKRRLGLLYAESIASEAKREVGKRLQGLLGIPADFSRPDAVVLVKLPGGGVEIQVMPLLVRGVYWKRGRRVSQSYWVTHRGVKRYPLSVEEALWAAARLYGAEEVVLHASGREDADARMLGTGRPFIVEFKKPRRRSVEPRLAEEAVEEGSRGLVAVRLDGEASRRDVAELKTEHQRRSKLYKALVVVSREIRPEDLEALERELSRRMVRQRTPRRVRHRRPDVVRERMVYSVKTVQVAPNVLEALIHAEGGLYIKELVSGDEGGTEPSFASILGAEALCVELDVVGVIHQGAPGSEKNYNA